MDLDLAVERIVRITVAIGVTGAAIYFALDGWRGGCGFLLGAVLSYLNFRWLKRTVSALGQTAKGKPPRAWVAVLSGLRYLLLGLGAYVIVRFSEIRLTAFLAGLFAPAAAVILEILFELTYGT